MAVESKYINKSLLSLESILLALANRAPRIPYRDSKLCQLLKHSMWSVCILASISPARCMKREIIEYARLRSWAEKSVSTCKIKVPSCWMDFDRTALYLQDWSHYSVPLF